MAVTRFFRSMKIRGVLIILVIGLCIAFVTEFWLLMDEVRRIQEACDRSPGFSCDYVLQHPVALLHAVSFALLAAVVFARKYYTALAVAVGYAAADIFGTYARVGTGFLGGDICPEGHPCWAAIRRATWFDWTALIVLVVSIGLIGSEIFRRKSRGLALSETAPVASEEQQIAPEPLQLPHEPM